MEDVVFDKVLHVKVTGQTVEALQAEAHRLNMKPSEVMRLALSLGLRALSEPLREPQGLVFAFAEEEAGNGTVEPATGG